MKTLETAKELVDRIVAETGLPKSTIAKKAGLAPTYLYRLLSGDIELTAGMAARIKKSFLDIWPEMRDGIPYYPVDFSTGYDDIFENKTCQPSMDIIHPLTGMAELWLQNRSNAMAPLIEPGDVIALRSVDIDSVVYGRVYAIVTRGDRLIRRIRRSEQPGYWRLVPDNKKDFDEQDINVSSVIQVFAVDAISRKISL